MQIDSTNTDLSSWLNSLFRPEILIGLIAILITILFYYIDKRKKRPTMKEPEFIFDQLGARLLFTIISNNSAGTHIGKLVASKRFLKIFYGPKIELAYQPNDEFLTPKIGRTIPDYIIKGQKTFITPISGSLLYEKGIYKITFYTSDGHCSNYYYNTLGDLWLSSIIKTNTE